MGLQVSTIIQWSPHCSLLGINATIQYLVVQYYLKDVSASAASMRIQTNIIISDLVLAMRTGSSVDS